MSIHRAPRPSCGFTLIRDAVLRDTRLSYRARGVLVAILSRPDNWVTSADQLATEGSEGRDAIRTALSELDTAGYVERLQIQDSKGRWGTHTIVYDEPQSGESQSPKTENQSSVNQPSVSQALKKNNLEEQPKDASLADFQDDRFRSFYASYPRKTARGQAARAWRTAIKKAAADEIIEASAAFGARVSGTDPQFIPHPATWLNGERWADEESTVAVRPRGMPETW